MDDPMEEIRTDIENNETKLWELITAQDKLRKQTQVLEQTLKHTNSSDGGIQSTEKNAVFDSIAETTNDYEIKLWQLLEDKTILDMKLKRLRAISATATIKAEGRHEAAILSQDSFITNNFVNVKVTVESISKNSDNNQSSYNWPSADHFEWSDESSEFTAGDNLNTSQSQLCDEDLKTENKLTECRRKIVRQTQSNPHGGKTRYSCPECSETFYIRAQFWKHIKIHTNGKPFECYLCHRRYPLRVSLRCHFWNHSVNRSIACGSCDQKFFTLAYLNFHTKNVHGNHPDYLCSECGKAYRTNSGLKQHQISHGQERKHRKYEQKEALAQHLSSHSSHPFECELCKKRYVTLCGLEQHKKLIHESAQKDSFSCDVCGRTYALAESLRCHFKTHSGKKTQCPVCYKYFNSEEKQLQHIQRMHTGERRFECTDCKRRFVTTTCLKQHQITHSTIKDFECTQCEWKFATAALLKQHQKVHSDARPFKCNQCDSSFKEVANLRRHVNSHTNVKPYACEVCDARFSDPSYIKIHMRIHTGEKPFACTVCDRRFLDQRNMKKHMKIHSK